MKRRSKKALGSDHTLVKEVKEIEKRIAEVCQKFTQELGFEVGWSCARELASGMSPYDLNKLC